MRALVVVLHGILTRQTDPSWPDRFDAWLANRDPEMRVLKKEYAAGPFPRWNCWVQDRRLARSLEHEILLFASSPFSGSKSPKASSPSLLPPTWFLAHSNGAVIALSVTQRLASRGCWVGGLILTGAACEPDVRRNGVLEWTASGRLGAAVAYSSSEDSVLAGDARFERTLPGRIRAWCWGKLMWPYGCLGRTGWVWSDTPARVPRPAGRLESAPFPNIATRWFAGGHSGYFQPQCIERTFDLFYHDITRHREPHR